MGDAPYEVPSVKWKSHELLSERNTARLFRTFNFGKRAIKVS